MRQDDYAADGRQLLNDLDAVHLLDLFKAELEPAQPIGVVEEGFGGQSRSKIKSRRLFHDRFLSCSARKAPLVDGGTLRRLDGVTHQLGIIP
jgi:hypothetical protein